MAEVELKYIPEAEKHSQYLSVGTKTNCFVCLSNISRNDNESLLEDTKTRNVSLLRICRYLKINLPDIISTQSSGIVLLPDKISKLVVNICNDCNSLVENISNLLEQLELLQMKVDYAMGKFKDVFKETRKYPETVNTLQVSCSYYDAGPRTSTITAKNLRHEITKNCDKMFSGIEPKVIIEDVLLKYTPNTTEGQDNISPAPSPHVIEPSSLSGSSSTQSKIFTSSPHGKNWKCSVCSCSYTQRKNLWRHQRKTHPKYKIIDLKITHCKTPKKKGSGPVLSDLRMCTLCTPNRSVPEKHFGRHRMCYHFESYFISHRPILNGRPCKMSPAIIF